MKIRTTQILDNKGKLAMTLDTGDKVIGIISSDSARSRNVAQMKLLHAAYRVFQIEKEQAYRSNPNLLGAFKNGSISL